jgi:2-keto-4-pentenoate hydratase
MPIAEKLPEFADDTGFLYTGFGPEKGAERVADTRQGPVATARAIAEQFVAARLAAAPLDRYPGPVPPDLDAAYACQDEAIALWPDTIGGWKVGWINAGWQRLVGEERLVGPIFRSAIIYATSGQIVDLPLFDGGFSAVEAEFVVRIGHDAPAGKTAFTPEEAAGFVGALHIGVESAGSPLATINDLGPCVVASDFGNNAGLVIGAAIPDALARDPHSLTCETRVDGDLRGRGDAATLHGGPLASLAFALGRCARRGQPLKTGDYVSTGAVDGIHAVRIGQSAVVSFGTFGEIRCRTVTAGPLPAGGHGAIGC